MSADAQVIHVRLFARAKELAGAEEIAVSVAANAKVADLRRSLAVAQPRLGGLIERSAIAVNNELADDNLPLPPEAEIALLPPVSGGLGLAEFEL